ncbi:hypothetical protein ROA7450_02326 [Roseovarius albus]|uniref:Uncharacterized protein n=1 Tax=Roseovarius albus TaxID=1247867 RepID=A0A1X6ZC88_9RHOB|nr:hypothetical protein [Roseovarius albus]SLN47087.1 hypothetical protein ROA7450_02326 [Roseovarius albus]
MSDLKPANENRWYVLMTLYGEQDGDEIDWALHEKNVAAWNSKINEVNDRRTWRKIEKKFKGRLPSNEDRQKIQEEIPKLH